jgi:hypothetical protein
MHRINQAGRGIVTLEIEGRPLPGRSGAARPAAVDPILIGLVNNMPDAALEATEAQFSGLLRAAAGPFTAVAACLQNTWRTAATEIYRNWLAFIAAAKIHAKAATSARALQAQV